MCLPFKPLPVTFQLLLFCPLELGATDGSLSGKSCPMSGNPKAPEHSKFFLEASWCMTGGEPIFTSYWYYNTLLYRDAIGPTRVNVPSTIFLRDQNLGKLIGISTLHGWIAPLQACWYWAISNCSHAEHILHAQDIKSWLHKHHSPPSWQGHICWTNE